MAGDLQDHVGHNIFILVKVGARPWSCVHIWFFCTIECYFSGKDGGGGGPGNVFTCCVFS